MMRLAPQQLDPLNAVGLTCLSSSSIFAARWRASDCCILQRTHFICAPSYRHISFDHDKDRSQNTSGWQTTMV
jgi:hypothetical protein